MDSPADLKRARRPRASAAPGRVGGAATEFKCTISAKFFQLSRAEPLPLPAVNAVPMPDSQPLPGYLCQGARVLLGLTQGELGKQAGVSKRTLIDYEAGRTAPSDRLLANVRSALETRGARFVFGDGIVGVIVYGAG